MTPLFLDGFAWKEPIITEDEVLVFRRQFWTIVAFVSEIEYLFRSQFRSHIEIYIKSECVYGETCLESRGKLGSTAQDKTYHAAHHVGECTPARAGKRCCTWYKAAAARLALF